MPIYNEHSHEEKHHKHEEKHHNHEEKHHKNKTSLEKHDGYDSGDDEEDHDSNHHHDQHDTHHHHHADVTTEDGTNLKLNVYHHDPKHGKEPYHLHAVPVFSNGKKEIHNIYHYGNSEHIDEPRGHSLYYLNKYPVVKKYTPTPTIAEKPHHSPSNDFLSEQSTEPYQPLHDHIYHIPPPPFAPSAPFSSKSTASHHARLFTSVGKNSETTTQEATKEDNCCTRPCIIL